MSASVVHGVDQEIMSLGVKYDSALAEYVNYTDGQYNKWLRTHQHLTSFGSLLVLSLPMFLGIYLGSQKVTMLGSFFFVISCAVVLGQVLSADLKYSKGKRELQGRAMGAAANLCREVVRKQTDKVVNVSAVVEDEGEDGVTAYVDFQVFLVNIRYNPTSEVFFAKIESKYGTLMEYSDTVLMDLIKDVYEQEILPELNVLHIGVSAE